MNTIEMLSSWPSPVTIDNCSHPPGGILVYVGNYGVVLLPMFIVFKTKLKINVYLTLPYLTLPYPIFQQHDILSL